MRLFFSRNRNREIDTKFPIALNASLICLGIFTLIAMSAVLGVFEEFTAFTDYTQSWIEFNFFIHYWDKLAIARVYLSFLFIYGAVVLTLGSMEIHGLRKKNINLLYFTPYLLLFVAVISILGAICWLIVTAVNHNEGFLATGGFIFERMRFKGNVWKDLKYREQSFRVVAAQKVPRKAPILYTWVHQRERDFSCCGWDSYDDYRLGGWSQLPESCCIRKYRMFQCGANYINDTSLINTRGCGPLMHRWYRTGFASNIIMAIIGIGIASFEFFLYTINRKEYFKHLYELDEYKKPMINSNINVRRGNTSPKAIYSNPPLVINPPITNNPPSIPTRNFRKKNIQEDNDPLPDPPEFLLRPSQSNTPRIYRPIGGGAPFETEKLNN